MRGQLYLDLTGAFLALMLIAASGFAALEKMEKGQMEAAAQCSAKMRAVSYADWVVKGGGTVSKSNADGSGYYLHHEVDAQKISIDGSEIGISVFAIENGQEKEIVRNAGAAGTEANVGALAAQGNGWEADFGGVVGAAAAAEKSAQEKLGGAQGIANEARQGGFGQADGHGISGGWEGWSGNAYCVNRVALCEGKICRVGVCAHDDA